MKFNILSCLLFFTLSSCSQKTQNQDIMDKPLQGDAIPNKNQKLETAYFGAGCFWCVEAVFQELKGVYSVKSGYMGGTTKNPTYRDICSGTTGHAEIVKLTFDPKEISFPVLLEILWTTHDPTTLNRQGGDRGTQYRSAVFYNNEDQRKEAKNSKLTVATKIWDDPIVTEITGATTYYPADEYHQNYYKDNPNQGYCQVVINPKIQKVREKFADKLKD